MEHKTDPRPPEWTTPTAAYAEYRPGLSPYLHYWQGLRAMRDLDEPPAEHGSDSARKVPEQMRRALEELISRSFGS